MENYFETAFEDVRHERLLPLMQSLTVPNILKQSKFTEYELLLKKHSALDKLDKQRLLKENVPVK